MKGLCLTCLLFAAPVLAGANVAIDPVDPSQTCRADSILAERLSASLVVTVVDGAAALRVRLTPNPNAWLLELFNADGSKRLERRLTGALACDDLVLAAQLIIERAVRELGPAVSLEPPPPPAPPLETSWGFTALGAARPLTGAFGGGLKAHIGLGSIFEVGVLVSLTTADVAKVTIDGLERGTMATTPVSAWFQGGPCLGEQFRFCASAVAGARVWNALAEGPYLFHATSTWAANPLVGLGLFGRAGLPFHLALELGAVGLYSIASPVFGIEGSPNTTFSAQPFELDLFAGIGGHFD